jgi:hypothetical protein
LPTHLKDGTELTESKRKTLKKGMLLQAKKHEKYQEAVKKGLIKT